MGKRGGKQQRCAGGGRKRGDFLAMRQRTEQSEEELRNWVGEEYVQYKRERQSNGRTIERTNPSPSVQTHFSCSCVCVVIVAVYP